MSTLQGNERSKYVQQMFGRIAHRYDLLNRLMTFGQDLKWRKEAIGKLEAGEDIWLLDLGTGTGDIAYEIKKQYPRARVIASDFTFEMIAVGRERATNRQLIWVIADAQNLPFASNSVRGVISGYLLRNVPDCLAAIQEQYRVVMSGSKMVSLDTTPPKQNLLKPFIELYLRYGIPLLGKLVAGDSEAYTYLPDSTRRFVSAEALAQNMKEAGFERVDFVRRMFGTMAIHWGKKV
jgi:demethylmenaquinone methyltransferase / 2-methoxy-6-polyprenyl-1,4-benzoquinol methylase